MEFRPMLERSKDDDDLFVEKELLGVILCRQDRIFS